MIPHADFVLPTLVVLLRLWRATVRAFGRRGYIFFPTDAIPYTCARARGRFFCALCCGWDGAGAPLLMYHICQCPLRWRGITCRAFCPVCQHARLSLLPTAALPMRADVCNTGVIRTQRRRVPHNCARARACLPSGCVRARLPEHCCCARA